MNNLLCEISAPGSETSSGAPAAHRLSVDTVTGLAGLEALAGEWQALERLPGSRTTPFQTFRLHLEWARHFAGPSHRLRILTVRSDGALTLVVPLVIHRTPAGALAEWMGSPILQYGDVIAAPCADIDSQLDAAMATLRAHGDVSAISLRRVREDAACRDWLEANMQPVGPADLAVGVDLTPFACAETFRRTRRQRATRNRKRVRRMQQQGAVGFRVLEGGREAADTVAAAYALKQDWLDSKGELGRALSNDRALACLRALADSGDAAVSVIDVDGRPAAIEVALRHDGHHCAYLGAFDARFAKSGPGNVQMQHTIEWCIDRGESVYDLLEPADSYKRELGSAAVEVRDYAARLSIMGLPTTLWSTQVRRAAKSAYEGLPPALRRAVRRRML